jgi:hypothetical protein
VAQERSVIRALAWGLWAAIVVGFAVVTATGGAEDDGAGGAVAVTVFVLAFATVGALVATRRPRNPIGWILLGAAVSYTLGGLSVSRGGEGPPALEWLSTWIWLAGIGPAATFGLLLFPDGRLPSPRWRGLGWLAGAANVLVISGLALAPGRFEGTAIDNPVGLEAAAWLPGAMEGIGAAALAIALAGSIASVIVRFRRARDVERQQLKWLAYAGALVGFALAFAAVLEVVILERAVELTNVIVSLALAAVPVAMGIAILRHRLYDIDLVIRRTLVYGALTGTLGATYLGSVLLVGLAAGESDLAIAVSTLAVAALFGPARARIQGAVDRRFYRRRYDAARTLEAFGARLRHELDLEALAADLRGVVDETVQPAHVSLWLRR